ncbi:MAG: hypothetical protein NVSMB2_13540 [Chloroflexota bacterium]
MRTASATTQFVTSSARPRFVARIPTELWTLGVPWLLLAVGAAVGAAWTLNPTVARERLVGLAVSGVVACVVLRWLDAVRRPTPLLIAVSVTSLLASVWVIAATGPDIFRGVLGRALDVVFAPVFWRATVTDPIEIANTRFIVGYNGLVDLCAVATFCCGAVILERRRHGVARHLLAPLLLAAIALVLLVGTGARGGLTGLTAGVCAIGLVVWPRRYAVLAIVAAPLTLAAATLGVLDKGLEFSSTAGRLNYWSDLARLLGEYPLTGVGLGVDTAYRATLRYEINPDPERIFYAHNTFVQTYLEMGPLATLGMLLVPVALGLSIVSARRFGIDQDRRTLVLAGVGVGAAMTAHGLTDQVVTTTVGLCLLLASTGAAVTGLTREGRAWVARVMQRIAIAILALTALIAVNVVLVPAARARALLDLGSLQLAQALALDTQAPTRSANLANSQRTLESALTLVESDPAILRQVAWARSAQYDDSGALDAVGRAARTPRLDPFNELQVAHLYRELGFAREAYDLAAKAYAATGRSTEDAVMQTYAQSTLGALDDFRARTLADQAEAAMRARRFGEAVDLFTHALSFQPDSSYLQDRAGAAQRAVVKYGG